MLPESFQSDNYLLGYFGKDLVKAMLEKAGYTVCHYSYEDTLLDYMSKHTSKTSNSNTGRRIRKSPDLLVYDENTIFLTEIKTRTSSPPTIGEMGILKEFWNDAILVVIFPEKSLFYAQEVAKLDSTAFSYPLASFRKIQEIFTSIREEHLSYYRKIATQTLQMFMTEKQKARLNSTMVS
jgi:hypothetical protein